MWDRWAPDPVTRGVFLLFWTVVGIHFANRGSRWYSGGKAVSVTGAAVALVILRQELRKRLGKGGGMEERVKLAEEPKFSWLRMAWKGLRPALLTALVAGATAFALSIDAKTLTDLGVPTVLSLFVVEAARNWAKQHIR